MKSWLSFGTALLLTASCADKMPRGSKNDVPALFVHFFIPTCYFEDSTEPPKLIATARMHLSEPFTVEHLSGVVEARGTTFYARLQGDFPGTTSHVDGELELEKPVAGGGFFSGYIPVLGFFVLSTNANSDPFLKQMTQTANVK